MGRLQYLKDVVTLELDVAKCTGCRMCVEVCPHGVFAIEEKKARLIDLDSCMECGACQNNCPAGAISVGAGVGCAQAVINGFLRGTEPDCDCSNSCCG
ncbi:MAG: mercury methylation ferredoxin HgcB [Planctomycetota bacterium]|jgi:NAD-dependent dihydropyrimidine dehydrogenase PreA subunit